MMSIATTPPHPGGNGTLERSTVHSRPESEPPRRAEGAGNWNTFSHSKLPLGRFLRSDAHLAYCIKESGLLFLILFSAFFSLSRNYFVRSSVRPSRIVVSRTRWKFRIFDHVIF